MDLSNSPGRAWSVPWDGSDLVPSPHLCYVGWTLSPWGWGANGQGTKEVNREQQTPTTPLPAGRPLPCPDPQLVREWSLKDRFIARTGNIRF